MDYFSLAIGLALLVLGSSYAVEYAVAMAKRLRLHVTVFGAVIVAVGTSLPELAITVESALKGVPDLIIGNILGSNIANVGLVLGAAILLGRITTNHDKLIAKNSLLLGLSLLFLGLLQLKLLFWPAGLLLLAFAVSQIIGLTKEREDLEAPEISRRNTIVGWSVLSLGLLSVIVGSRIVINSSLAITEALGISVGVVAATIVAIGTSLPELVITIAAVKKREHGLAIGNILGSNLINLSLIGGVGALLANLNIDISPLTLVFFLLFSIIVFLLASGRLDPKPRQGAYLLVLYAFFIIAQYTIP